MIKKTKLENIQKYPLLLDQYAKYEIPQEYSAYRLDFLNITAEQIDDLEYEYLKQGNKIFGTETKLESNGLFTHSLIMAQLPILIST